MCDNTQGVAPTKCTYSHTIGTKFSDTLSEGMKVDITVEAELKAEFFDIFSADIGVSATTGYDWTHATDSTKSEQTTITVEAEAPPGK